MSPLANSLETPDAIVALTAPMEGEATQPDAATAKRRPLGQQLLGASLLSNDDLEAALAAQATSKQPLGETLLEMGAISEEHLLPYIEVQLSMPAVRLREGLLDPIAVRLLPRELAEQLHALVLFRVHRQLVVAMHNPSDLEQIDLLERVSGFEIRPVFAFRTAIERMLKRGYEDDFEVDAVTADMEDDAVELQADITTADIASVQDLVEGSPVINLVNYLILQSIRKSASDIHIEPSRNHGVVRFRIDGQLVEMLRPRRDIYPAIVSRIKVMAKLDIAEQRVPQDGRFQVIVDGKQVDLRISTLPTVIGEKVVMRVLDRQRLTFNLDELGIPLEMLPTMKSLLARPYGLFLVTGPTGSGKTTTLYSALELIKSVHRNIVTVEDPVEYQVEMVNQVQIDATRSMSFASALRAILRQDPDVIMVGEIRDAETAKVAVQAALTGHLVLSTLHTNDSVGAITRLRDMGIESYKIASALVGVLAQRLIRTICPKCRTSYYANEEELRSLRYRGDTRRAFARGEGCRDCFDTGFQGRHGVYELLPNDSRLRQLIAADVDQAIRNYFREQKISTLLDGGIELAKQEVTSLEEVARIALFD